MDTDIRELLAAYAHEAWADWMRYLFKKSRLRGNGSVVIPAKYVANLQRAMGMPYDEMPESSKESYLVEADMMLALMEATNAHNSH